MPPFSFTPVTYTTAGDFTVAIPARALNATFRGIAGGAGGSSLSGYIGGGGGGCWARKTFSVVGLTNIYIRIGAGGTAGIGEVGGYGMSTIVWGDGFNGANMLFRAAGNVEQNDLPHLAGISSQCISDSAFSGGEGGSIGGGGGGGISLITSGAGAGNSLSIGGNGTIDITVTGTIPGGVDGDGTDPAGAGAPVTSGTPGAAGIHGGGGAAKRTGTSQEASVGARGWGFLTMSAT